MRKQSKIYNLALKRQNQDNSMYTESGYMLNVISQIPQNSSLQQLNKDGRTTINIFDQQRCYQSKKLITKNKASYNILCIKQVQAFKQRLKKLKTFGTASSVRVRQSESFMSSSRHTGMFTDLTHNNHLTKEDLSNFYNKSLQKFNTMNTQINKSNANNPLQSSIADESKAKSLLKKNLSKIQDSSSIATKKMIDRSKLSQTYRFGVTTQVSLQNHRKKVQKLQKITLAMQKQNMQPVSLINNLRNPKPLKTLLDSKHVQQIKRQGIRIKGLNKLQKQYCWIKNDKKTYYFEPIQSKQKFVKKVCKTITQESRILNTFLFNQPSINHCSYTEPIQQNIKQQN